MKLEVSELEKAVASSKQQLAENSAAAERLKQDAERAAAEHSAAAVRTYRLLHTVHCVLCVYSLVVIVCSLIECSQRHTVAHKEPEGGDSESQHGDLAIIAEKGKIAQK